MPKEDLDLDELLTELLVSSNVHGCALDDDTHFKLSIHFRFVLNDLQKDKGPWDYLMVRRSSSDTTFLEYIIFGLVSGMYLHKPYSPH